MDAPKGMRAPRQCRDCDDWYSAVDEGRCAPCADRGEPDGPPPFPKVKGVCPSCGEAELRLTEDGHVWCAERGCPGPYTVANLLVDTAHYVDVVDNGWDESDSLSYGQVSGGEWSMEHPLGCRVAGRRLLDCEVHRLIVAVADAGTLPMSGRYKVIVPGPNALAWMREG